MVFDIRNEGDMIEPYVISIEAINVFLVSKNVYKEAVEAFWSQCEVELVTEDKICGPRCQLPKKVKKRLRHVKLHFGDLAVSPSNSAKWLEEKHSWWYHRIKRRLPRLKTVTVSVDYSPCSETPFLRDHGPDLEDLRDHLMQECPHLLTTFLPNFKKDAELDDIKCTLHIRAGDDVKSTLHFRAGGDVRPELVGAFVVHPFLSPEKNSDC